MNTPVYLVTKGSYSDYSVYGIFADKELAEEYAAQISDRWDTAHVSPRTLMTSSDLPSPPGFRAYNIVMDRDGNTQKVQSESCANEGDWYSLYDVEFENKKIKHVYTGRVNFVIKTDKGEEGAIKIANERRIRLIAENEWPEKGKVDELDHL